MNLYLKSIYPNTHKRASETNQLLATAHVSNKGRGQEETVKHVDLHVSLGTFMSCEKDVVRNELVIIQSSRFIYIH